MDDAEGSRTAGEKLLAVAKECNGCGCDCDAECKFIVDNADMLTKKSIWIIGGDGWAYDIGYGGLDHVIASGEDINIFVFDTEVYSNTGGQASKASQIGQVAQFAAAGKTLAKKDLAAIAMSYGYVYVAQVGVGADQAQTVKAITEAESYKGPSLVIGYAPCEMHGVKGGMGNSQAEIKAAVAAGYWHLFRFDPRKLATGGAFMLDSKEPTGSYQDFIKNETRYTSLQVAFPDRAEELFKLAEERAKGKYEMLKKKVEFYK
jgi:pyruvate-ferredoxin/flavodoxin oxidoreductase